MALTKADEEFIWKLNDIIQANLHNPEFSMEDMADALKMSRSVTSQKSDVTFHDYESGWKYLRADIPQRKAFQYKHQHPVPILCIIRSSAWKIWQMH